MHFGMEPENEVGSLRGAGTRLELFEGTDYMRRLWR